MLTSSVPIRGRRALFTVAHPDLDRYWWELAAFCAEENNRAVTADTVDTSRLRHRSHSKRDHCPGEAHPAATEDRVGRREDRKMTITGAQSSYTELNAVLERARRQPRTSTSISDDQLVALQARWTRALSARLDQAIEFAGSRPLVEMVAEAWRRQGIDQAILRGVLDQAESRCPALAAAMGTEFRYLALAAGLIGLDGATEDAVRVGRDYRDRIRSGNPASWDSSAA